MIPETLYAYGQATSMGIVVSGVLIIRRGK